MVFLTALSVGTIWFDTGMDHYLIWGTWAIFTLDFLYRFTKSGNKWQFIKRNPFLLVAIIPLDAVFQFARLARILHLLRLKTITKYYTMPFIRFLKEQNLVVVVTISFFFLFITIIPLYYIEPDIGSYQEAIYSALLSMVFFGKTNFDPNTMIAQFILVCLSILRVILYGLFFSIALDVLLRSSLVKQVRDKWKRK